MNKKLIALAVAGALGTPLVASAAPGDGVTLYGRVMAEFGSIDIDQTPGFGGSPAVGAPNFSDYRQESISDNAGTSRWGLKIVEDLGGGLKANARVEYGFRTGNGVADSAREQWVGLSHAAWGALQFGRVQSPFKDFAGGGTLDPFGSTNLQARGTGGALYSPGNGMGAASHVDHAIRYNSPSWGGFSMALLASPVDATQTEGTNGSGNIGGKGGTNNYQVGMKYKFGKAGEIFGGYSNDEASDAQAARIINGQNGDDEKVWRIGTAWNFGNFRIAGQYDKIENALAGNGGTSCSGGASATGNEGATITTNQCNTSLNANGDGDIWFLTTQYKIGKTTLVLQGGETKADAVGAMNEREAKNLTVGAIHSISKRTRVFAGYQRVSVDGARNVSNTLSTTTITTGSPPVAVAAPILTTQPDRSVWSLGLRHDF